MKLLHVKIEQGDDALVAQGLEEPGVITEGQTFDEIVTNVREAAELLLNDKDIHIELLVPSGMRVPGRKRIRKGSTRGVNSADGLPISHHHMPGLLHLRIRRHGSDSMTLEPIQLTKQETWEALRIQMPKRKRWTRWIPYAAVALGFLVLVNGESAQSRVAAALLVAMGLFSAIEPVWEGYAGAERWMKTQTELLPRGFELTEAHVVARSEEAYVEYKWQAIVKFVETRSLFLLFRTEDQAVFAIPKRGFRSASELADARELFRTCIRRDRSQGFPVKLSGASP